MLQNIHFRNIDDLPFDKQTFVGAIEQEIFHTDELLAAVGKALLFPPYYGRNWNALSDCLRDLHWLQQRRVVLIHKNIPKIDRNDLIIYLRILKDAADDWKQDEDHQFEIVFDERRANEVADLLTA